MGFQSTPSVWRATEERVHERLDPADFNPRPPCGGRRTVIEDPDRVFAFQSTPSVWRATTRKKPLRAGASISIHALRVEGDANLAAADPESYTFQSTPSVWRATQPAVALLDLDEFQSTPSVWRATRLRREPQRAVPYFNPRPPCGGRRVLRDAASACRVISIHALRVEGDGPRLPS